jgi:UDP:flavonoid glycosyltransferase YjiC (YdhE family)
MSRRFLFALWQGGGTVLPQIALAKRLARRGHDVRVLGPPSVAAMVPAECEAVCGAVPDWQPQRGLLLGEQIDELTRYLCGPEWRDAVAKELEGRPADAFVCDRHLSGATVASSVLGTPTALIVTCLFKGWYDEWGGYVLDGESTRDVLRRVDLTLALTPFELDFTAGELPPDVLYVGPVSDPDPVESFALPWPDENDDPLVVVTFSTIYQRQEVALGHVVEALADLPVRALVLAGEGLDVQLPTSVCLRRWVPHAAVMPCASLCVTHGGCGTTMSALAAGVPLLVLPHVIEQALNGHRVSELRAGRLFSADAESPEIRAAVLELLEDPSYKAAAERVSGWFDDGSQRAVEALETLADG